MNPEHRAGHYKTKSPLAQRQCTGTERRVQRRRVHHCDLQGDGQANCPHSHRLANSPRNALVDSERAHNALNNCANTRTVNPPVRASASDASPAISPPGSIQSNVNKLANAMTSPTSITPGDLSSHAITSESPLKRQTLSQLGVGSFPHALLAPCLFAHTAGTFIGFVGGPLCLACHFHCQFCLEVRLIGP